MILSPDLILNSYMLEGLFLKRDKENSMKLFLRK